jgi:lipopolysaccharide export system permease protein
MLFRQSLKQELSRTFSATLVILITIVMTMMLIRTLGLASKGIVNPQEVMLVMAYSALGHIPTILTLALFVTLISTLSRMMRESEYVIWLSSGQSLLGFIRPLFEFSIPTLIAIAVMSLLIWPWTNAQMQDLRDRFESRDDLERVVPGEFQESASGRRVFYIDKKPDAKAGVLDSAQNIFIATFDNDKKIITTAQSGRIDSISGDKFLILEKGQRIELGDETKDIKITQFETLGARVGSKDIQQRDQQAKSTSTYVLLTSPTNENLGELAWRISLTLAAINFVLLALALSIFNPRSSKGGHLLFALLSFIIYYNMINVSQAWIASGQTPIVSAMLALHGFVFVVSCGWIFYRHKFP